MEHLNNPNVLAVVRPSNETTFWLDKELLVAPEWKTPGLIARCIVITLQDRPFTSAGVVFGTSKACEVVVSKTNGTPSAVTVPFEKVHFSIGLDHEYRLVARDLTGGQGIRVIYNKRENTPDGRNSQWILAGPGVPDRYRELQLGQPEPLRLRIIVEEQFIFDILPGEALQSLRARSMEAQLFRQGKEPNSLLWREVPITVPRYLNDGVSIKSKIGKGGFGVVNHCWNPYTGQQYVVKRPDPKYLFNKGDWKQEARLMDLARHPNIVEFLGGADFDTTPCIAMEYVALGALRDHEDISRIEAMLVLRQCASALSFLHSHRPAIIHRDIKPHNILVQQRGAGGADGHIVVKLCDFGLAREEPRERITSKPGSLPYEPPEYHPVGGCKPWLGVMIDMWCLGLVVFELVSGIEPVYSKEVHKKKNVGIRVGKPMHDKIVEDLHRFADNANQGDFTILKNMLAINPNDRISAEVAHKLAEGMEISAFESAQTGIATATEPGIVAGQTQPLVDQAGQSQPLVDQAGQSQPLVDQAGQSQPLVDQAGQAQPLVDQAYQNAADDMRTLSITEERRPKRKRPN